MLTLGVNIRQINEIYTYPVGLEKAGVGGSIPSLATTLSNS